MPKILKIVGKSALCFAGLVAASWLLMQLDGLNTVLGNTRSVIIVMFMLQMRSFTLPFILAIAYSYILFRLFTREQHCYLIIALNGLFVLVLYIVLLFFQIDTYNISYLDVMMAHTYSIPVMALALMYKHLSRQRRTPKKVFSRAANALIILIKFLACMFLLVVLAVTSYAFMELRIPMFIIMFLQEIGQINLLTAIVYSCVFYILFRRHKHIFWIIAVNSAVLLIVWGLIILSILPFSILFSYVCFNTSLIPLVLTIVFRSVEKRATEDHQALNGCKKEDTFLIA